MDFVGQLRQVLRRFGRAPLFTSVTLITLATCIGGNILIFSVLEGILLKPLAYPRPQELVSLLITAPGVQITDCPLSASDYFIFREQNKTFQDIGLLADDSFSVTGVSEPSQEAGLDITDGTLPLLGVAPVLGRSFRGDDDSPSAPETVMISYGYWQQRFGGASSVIGRSIIADGVQRQIIGVLPQNLHFLDHPDPAIVALFRLDRSKTQLGNFAYHAVARLKPGVTIAEASADVARMLPIVLRSFPTPPGVSLQAFEEVHFGPNLAPLKKSVVGDIGKLLWVLMGSLVLVLLIACANVANLLLVRVEGRRQELAVRVSLGANWGRIAGDILFESVFLALIGSVLGLGLAAIALRVFVSIAPAGLPRLQEISINPVVLLFTLLLAVLAGLLFGAVPIFKYAGIGASAGVREGGRALSQSREQRRARNGLVVIQVALALVLLICSGLMIRTFRALTHVNPGFTDPASLQTFRIFIPESEIKGPEQVTRAAQNIADKISAIPGVLSVSMGTAVPMDGTGNVDPVYVGDRAYREGELPPLRRFRYVAPGYFSTLGTAFIAGRDFSWTDLYNKSLVVILSENFAREYWETPRNALGKLVRVGPNDPWREVIGVVADTYHDGVNQPAPATAYWPLLADRMQVTVQDRRNLAYAIRSRRAGSQSFLSELRQAVWSVDANLPIANINTEDYYYTHSMARTAFTLVMLAVAGGMALLLGVVGIYGVIAYSVSQRTGEIGIRMALGAQRPAVSQMFVRHGLILAGIGVACGLAIAFGVMRLMSSLLFRISPMDPVTYAAVSLGLLATAWLSSYLPSRRATSVDPVEALRGE